MSRHTCIYCLEEKAEDAFNREHVLPQAFGKFRNNLTLINGVCADCNSYFGSELDAYLARDTPVGLQRFVFGLKPAREYSSFRQSSMTHTITSGSLKGALVHQQVIGDSLHPVPFPQIALTNLATREKRWFLVSALPEREVLRALFEQGFREIEFCETEPEPVMEELRRRGVQMEGPPRKFREDGIQSEERIETRVTLGLRYARCMAKIAFNYLACRFGCGTARMAQFNEVRQFIRWGSNPTQPIWRPEQRGLVANAPPHFLGHTITIECEQAPQRMIGFVSLHENSSRHRIELAHGGFLLHGWLKAGGHHFDLNSMQVFEVLKAADPKRAFGTG